MNQLLFVIFCLSLFYSTPAQAVEVEVKADFDLMRNFDDVEYGDSGGTNDAAFGDDTDINNDFGELAEDMLAPYDLTEGHGDTLVDEDLSSPMTNELVIGSDQNVTRDLSMGLDYKYKKSEGSLGIKSTWDADSSRNAIMLHEQKEAELNKKFEGGPRPGHRVAPIDPAKGEKTGSDPASKDLKVHSVIKETGGNVPLV